MAQSIGHACAMCGKHCTEAILGVKGGICPSCIGVCNAVLAGPGDGSMVSAGFGVSEMGHCVMCDKGNSLKSAEYQCLRGANGDVCVSCLELCNEILNDVPTKKREE